MAVEPDGVNAGIGAKTEDGDGDKPEGRAVDAVHRPTRDRPTKGRPTRGRPTEDRDTRMGRRKTPARNIGDSGAKLIHVKVTSAHGNIL